MKDFLALHQNKITGVLGCFDRVIFRGYLPLQDGYSMAQFLNQNGLRFRDLKSFVFEQSNRVKFHAQAWAEREGRPFKYLASRVPMEKQAREMVDRDRIRGGWSVSSASSNRAARSRFVSKKVGLSCSLPDASVCACISTSWIRASASFT